MDGFGQNKEQIIQYLKNGCKDRKEPLRFGLELEHFIVKEETKEAVSYYGEKGVEDILTKLKPLYDKSVYSEGHLIALGREGITLSLEPAAQLEVSISPQSDIRQISTLYMGFVEEIAPILEAYSYKMVTFGYQPKSKVEDLELIPKARYRFMDRYFAKIGPYGRQMMRGTAATQVAIDYYSEDDFKRKYRIAYMLKDVLAYIGSHCPFYEGVPYKGHTLRDEIWSQTDKRRVDVAPFMKEGTLSFEDYADFVMQTPVIVNKEGTTERYDERTIGELSRERVFSKEELSHILSMVFPMIRAKHYLEIRIADSMPIPKVIYYLLVLKKLFEDIEYTESWVLSEEFGAMDLEQQVECLKKHVMAEVSEKEAE